MELTIEFIIINKYAMEKRLFDELINCFRTSVIFEKREEKR